MLPSRQTAAVPTLYQNSGHTLHVSCHLWIQIFTVVCGNLHTQSQIEASIYENNLFSLEAHVLRAGALLLPINLQSPLGQLWLTQRGTCASLPQRESYPLLSCPLCCTLPKTKHDTRTTHRFVHTRHLVLKQPKGARQVLCAGLSLIDLGPKRKASAPGPWQHTSTCPCAGAWQTLFLRLGIGYEPEDPGVYSVVKAAVVFIDRHHPYEPSSLARPSAGLLLPRFQLVPPPEGGTDLLKYCDRSVDTVESRSTPRGRGRRDRR